MESKFKNKIINAIEANKDTFLTPSSLRKEYFRLFKKMDSPENGHLDFKNTPKSFFEKFDYDLFSKKNTAEEHINITDFLPKYVNINEVNIVVLINGYFSEEYSKIISENLIAKSLTKKVDDEYIDVEKYFLMYAEQHENPLTILNTILAMDGLFLEIKKNAYIKEPIYILSIITEQEKNYLFNQKLLILAQKNSQATIIERKISLANQRTTLLQVKEQHQAENSHIDYYDLTDISENNIEFTTLNGNEYVVDKNSNFNLFTLDINPAFSRSQTNLRLIGENAETNINSFAFVDHKNIVDNKTLMEHKASNSKCSQRVKAIADKEGKFFFDGKIEICENINKIEAHQNTRGITLSNDATIICDPQLEIYADDVVCTHGAAIGSNDNDDELLFYLQSRGISETEARKMLLIAFAGEIYDKIKNEELRKELIDEFNNSIKF